MVFGRSLGSEFPPLSNLLWIQGNVALFQKSQEHQSCVFLNLACSCGFCFHPGDSQSNRKGDGDEGADSL